VNWRIIRAIAVKDWKEVLQNRTAMTSSLILPLVFVVVIPVLIIYIPDLASSPGAKGGGDILALIQVMPQAVREQIAGLSLNQAMVVLILGFFLAPMFLILPLMIASIVGADSIVGEKERKTLEALLYTPTSDGELYLAKIISSVVPAIAIAWGSFIIYVIVLNVAGAHLMGRIWFPLPHWWPLILWVAPAVATLGMSVIVLISSRVSTFMAAQQTSGLLVLPIALLVVAQATGVIYLSVGLVFALGVIVWLVDALLIWIGVRQFSRSRLMTRI
jgi:ABC-type Na+ efflux pump permease subunit